MATAKPWICGDKAETGIFEFPTIDYSTSSQEPTRISIPCYHRIRAIRQRSAIRLRVALEEVRVREDARLWPAGQQWRRDDVRGEERVQECRPLNDLGKVLV